MKKIRKPTQLELLSESIAQDYAHASSSDVMRYRTVVECQLEVTERKIGELIATLANAKADQKRTEAILAGLGVVIGKR